MRDQALAAAPKGLGCTVTSVTEPTEAQKPKVYRIIQGTFQVPSFESGPDPSPLHLDKDGRPTMGPPADFPSTASIPRCALTHPGLIPLLIVGHGIQGTTFLALSPDVNSGLLNAPGAE